MGRDLPHPVLPLRTQRWLGGSVASATAKTYTHTSANPAHASDRKVPIYLRESALCSVRFYYHSQFRMYLVF
jgi:hypothetical protein